MIFFYILTMSPINNITYNCVITVMDDIIVIEVNNFYTMVGTFAIIYFRVSSNRQFQLFNRVDDS